MSQHLGDNLTLLLLGLAVVLALFAIAAPVCDWLDDHLDW